MQEGEMPESQPSSKCEGGRNHECILQQRTETANIGIGNRVRLFLFFSVLI